MNNLNIDPTKALHLKLGISEERLQMIIENFDNYFSCHESEDVLIYIANSSFNEIEKTYASFVYGANLIRLQEIIMYN